MRQQNDGEDNEILYNKETIITKTMLDISSFIF